MGMDIGGGFGAGGATMGLQQLLAQRQMMRAYADQQNQLKTENAFKQQQLAQQDELKRAQIAEMAQASKDRAGIAAGVQQDREIGLASNLAEQVPGGTQMPFMGGTAQMLRTGGRDALLKDQGITAAEPPSAIAAPDQPPPSEMAGTINNAPSPQGRLVTKLNTSKQADTLADNERQLAALKQAGENQDWKNTIAQQLAELKGEKGPTSHYTEPKDVWNPKTGQFEPASSTFNTSTGSYEPVRGVAPGGAHKAAPGEAQDAAWNAKRSDAVAKLGIVDQSIDAAKDLIGPGAGRVATFEQMIGNPDPRIADLKTKLLTVKDQVVGALTRSNRQPSPAMMKRFDEILGTQLTPQSLHAATNALRQMLSASDGGTPTPGGSGIKSITQIP